MTKLIRPEKPLQLLPLLARDIGLNEAIILQQLHYWMQKSKNVREGKKWVYNSYREWREQFPFWTEQTIRRAVLSLKRQRLIIIKRHNKAYCDQRYWYTINYPVLETVPVRLNLEKRKRFVFAPSCNDESL